MLFVVLLLIQLQAKDTKWQKLKSLKEYSASDYTLKEGVEYLEIRTYSRGIEGKKYNIRGYRADLTMQRKALTSFSSAKIKKFKELTPNISEQTDIRKSGFCLMSGCISSIGNAFMIKSDGKMWRMNMVTDILEMLGEIDTPAEAKLTLWLNDTHRNISDKGSLGYKDKYRKIPQGYEVISQYDNFLDNFGECGNFTYKISINKQGKIFNKQLLKKKPSKNGCMTMD